MATYKEHRRKKGPRRIPVRVRGHKRRKPKSKEKITIKPYYKRVTIQYDPKKDVFYDDVPKKIMANRTKKAKAADLRSTSKKVYTQFSPTGYQWAENPDKSDLQGFDTKGAKGYWGGPPGSKRLSQKIPRPVPSKTVSQVKKIKPKSKVEKQSDKPSKIEWMGEPWQMSGKEMSELVKRQSKEDDLKQGNYIVSINDPKGRLHKLTPYKIIKITPKYFLINRVSANETKNYQIKRGSDLDFAIIPSWMAKSVLPGGLDHKEQVEKAIREGKPVPEKVLDQYPDLRRTQKANRLTFIKSCSKV